MVKYTRHTHCERESDQTDWGVGLIEYTDNLDFQIPEKLDIEYDVCSKKKGYGFLTYLHGQSAYGV